MCRILPTALAALLLLPAAASASPSVTAAPGRLAVTYDRVHRSNESFGALVAAGDGTVYAAGGSGRSRRLAITAFEADGSLARDFGDGGGARAPYDVRGGDALLRAADGSLLAVGRLNRGDGSTLGPPAAVRVAADGTFDRGYGGDGRAEVPGLSQAGCPGCGTAATAPDGGLLVAGLAGRVPEFRFAIARLRTDGSPDPAFGSGGVARPLPGAGGAASVVVQPTGRIVVIGFRGSASDPAAERTVLVGLRPDGSLDPSFGTRGIVELAVDAFHLEQDPAGRLLVSTVGESVDVLRFTPDGAPDPTWGSGGRASLGRQPFVAELMAVPDGLVLAAAPPGRVVQIRLDDGGRIVARRTTPVRFGGGSFLPGWIGPLGQLSFIRQSIVTRPDGSLAVGGSVFVALDADGGAIESSEAALALVRADGTLVATPASGRPRGRATVRRDRLRRIRRRGYLRVRFDPGRRGLARVIVTARGRRVARAMVPFWTARRTTARVRLTPAGRRLVRTAGRLRVRVRVARNDMAGNRGRAAAWATLRP